MAGSRVISFDFIRGLAALLVCAGHLRAVMFVNGSSIDSIDYFTKVFYFLTSLGHESVIIFFILSGFFVGGSVLNKAKKFKVSQYIKARCVRLLVVLVPSILFTFFIDNLIASFCRELLTGDFREVINLGPVVGGYDNSLITALGNMFFLQTIIVPVYGSNSVLWSIANEFWYYMLFPLIYFPLQSCFHRLRYPKFLYNILIVTLITSFLLDISGMLSGFIVWLMGVSLFVMVKNIEINRNLFNYKSVLLFLTFLIMAAIALLKSIDVEQSSLDVILGLVIILPLFLICRSDFFEGKLVSRVSVFLSNISYTLYLFHFPLVMLLFSVFFTEGRMQPSLVNYLLYILTLMTIVIISYFFWYLFERRTNDINKLMEKYVNYK